MAVTITVQSQSVGTQVLRIQAADATWTTVTALTRSDPWGDTYRVRNAAGAPVSGGVATIEDAEAPLGVDVTYYATVSKSPDGVTTVTDSGQATVHTLTDKPERVFLADANSPTAWLTPLVEEVPEVSRETEVGVYKVLGRATPVVTTGRSSSRSGSMSLLTATQDATDALWAMLNRADVLLFRTTRTYGVGSLYFVPTQVTESRFTRLGMFPQRRFAIEYTECDPPVGSGSAAAYNNWQRVLDNQPTWQSVLDTRPTWEKVLTDPYGVTPPPLGRTTLEEVSSASG